MEEERRRGEEGEREGEGEGRGRKSRGREKAKGSKAGKAKHVPATWGSVRSSQLTHLQCALVYQ